MTRSGDRVPSTLEGLAGERELEHGVVVTGWGEGDLPDEAGVTRLFDDMLAPGEHRQRRFATASEGLPPRVRLSEYDLLLRALYGPRRFRPFTL